MPDPVEIKIGGDSSGFKSEVDKTVKAINDIDRAVEKTARNQARLARIRGEMARNARAERDATFRRLPVEQQIEHLERRRLRIKEALVRASGNEARHAALLLQRQRIGNQLGALRGGGGGGAGAAVGGVLGGIGGAFAGVGIATVAFKLIGQTNQILTKFSSIANAADKLGIGSERYQQYTIAAQQTGATNVDIETAFRQLTTARSRAMSGSKNDIDTFKRLGVSEDDLRRSSVDQLFMRISSSIQHSGSDANKLADLFKVMGETSQNLLPAFYQGFEKLTQSIKDSGQVLSDEFTQELRNARDELDKLSNKWTVFKGTVVGFAASGPQKALPRNVGGFNAWKLIKYMATGRIDESEVGQGDEQTIRLDKLLRERKLQSPQPELPESESQFPGITAPNALAKQGLFVGTNPQVQVLMQQLGILRQQLSSQQAIQHKISTITD